MRLTILFLATMLVLPLVAGGAALAVAASCHDSGHGLYCDCPPSGGECTGTNLGEGEVITGSPNSDTIYGRGGHDEIYGQDADDRLYGGSGMDYIQGGYGEDWCYGGIGADYEPDDCEHWVP
jgi:RTX calcium-binding nonapeptide repeat (4 copies)